MNSDTSNHNLVDNAIPKSSQPIPFPHRTRLYNARRASRFKARRWVASIGELGLLRVRSEACSQRGGALLLVGVNMVRAISIKFRERLTVTVYGSIREILRLDHRFGELALKVTEMAADHHRMQGVE